MITAFYQQEMLKAGWEFREDMIAETGSNLVFFREGRYIFFLIKRDGEFNSVLIHPVDEQ